AGSDATHSGCRQPRPRPAREEHSAVTETISTLATISPRHPQASDKPTPDTWQGPPHNRWAFAHVREFVPTAQIPARAPARRAVASLDVLAVPGLESRLDEAYTDAFIVVRNGTVVAEYFREGFARDDAHVL